MSKSLSHSDVFHPIRKELEQVEKTWQTCFREASNRTIKKINGVFRNSTGKRLRPGLAILAAGAVLGRDPRPVRSNLVNVASAIELLHTASLIHDDTIDAALIRHHQPTINARFGSHVSIAFGDYVYSWALKLISTVSDPVIFDCFAHRTFDLCEGELVQIIERKNLDMSPARYFAIIRRKTAALFALSGETGALVADPANRRLAQAMREFGLNFGIAYQIIDDMRDLVADQGQLGKEPGADFQAAELTLPMIFLLKDPRLGKEIRSLFEASEKDGSFDRIRQLAVGSEALKKTRTRARAFLRQTRASLAPLPASLYKTQLSAMVDWLGEKV